jgi:hypothetical protein
MHEVRPAHRGDGVQVDVDDVVQHAHRCANGALQTIDIQPVSCHMRREIDRSQVADCGLVLL